MTVLRNMYTTTRSNVSYNTSVSVNGIGPMDYLFRSPLMTQCNWLYECL